MELTKKKYYKAADGTVASAKLYTTLAEVYNQGTEEFVDGQKCYAQYCYVGDSTMKYSTGGTVYSVMPKASADYKPSQMIQVSTNKKTKGIDRENLRDTYIPAEKFTYYNSYVHPTTGKTIKGEWITDEGESYMPVEVRESRYFCLKGMLEFKFTGRSLVIRLMIDGFQGKANVLIDGVPPSTLCTPAVDVLDCHLELYFDDGQPRYHDITVAEGLEYKEHTCKIYANNAKDKWFILSAAKVRDFGIKPVVVNGYHEELKTGVNNFSLKLTASKVDNIILQLPPQIRNQQGEIINNPLTIANQGQMLDFAVDGTKFIDKELDLSIKVLSDYKDRNGNIYAGIKDQTHALTDMKFSNGWWQDTDNPSKTLVAYSEGANETVKFSCPSTSFIITVEKDWGWGRANVSIEGSPTVYATLSCHDEDLALTLVDVAVAGLPPGEKTIVLTTLDAEHGKPFVFSKVSFKEETICRRIEETIPIKMILNYIKPFGVTGVKYENGEYTWDNIDLRKVDYTIPRSNIGVEKVEIMQHYPTFAVNYSDQKHENLKYYDLIVIDPRTCSRKEVKEWQDMGIKVFGYVTFGEEDDVVVDPFASEQTYVPHTDDGGGVGGYASYYNKGGNGFSEVNQCCYDCQIEVGEKRCQLGQSQYFTGDGACTCVCMNDWSQGFHDWDAGKPCKGGYTAKNNWKREEDIACSNKGCPKYTPYNSKCPSYESYYGWGQDLSLANTTFPDRNGIWTSSYINPLAPRWKEKLKTYYLSWVFGSPRPKTETVTVKKYTDTIEQATSFVFQVSDYPIDKDEPVKITTADGYTYATYDYYFDNVTGAFWIDVNAGIDDGKVLTDGAQLIVSYSTAGINADGVFMDTVDTVDIYPSEAFQQGMANMINELKADFPDRMFISNRGFSILPKIIKSCSHVMFETFISEYDWRTGEYYALSNPDSIEWNNEVKKMLRELRTQSKFDVIALNYCADGKEGDELRELIAQECYKQGYMSWSSNIFLDNPLMPYKIKSNKWKEHVDKTNPFFHKVTAVNRAIAVKREDGTEYKSEELECPRMWTEQDSVERDEWYKTKEYKGVAQ